MKIPFCGITYEKLLSLPELTGYNDSQLLKVVTSFYRRGIHDFDLMNDLPKSFRVHLKSVFDAGLREPDDFTESSDHSVKYLFSPAGNVHETVFIPEKQRRTVCISTQSGCRMGCPFCLTGTLGFNGNLTAGEIVNQVISMPGSASVTHVVLMGMGEPLDNIDEVLTTCKILTTSWGLALSPGHITVSTVGITNGIKRFLSESGCNLTLSLFSPFRDERVKAIPAEKVYPATDIVELMKNYPDMTKRRFSIAYLMIHRVNDSDRHLAELIRLLKGSNIRVNLLPYHTTGKEGLEPSPLQRIDYFRHHLMQSGISSSVRKSRGEDISAACGMLVASIQDPQPSPLRR